MLSLFFFIFFKIVIVDTITGDLIPPFPALLHLCPTRFPYGNYHTVVSVCGLCIHLYGLWLIPSPSFIQPPPPPDSSQSIPCVHTSVS